MQPQFILFVIFIISSIGAQQLTNDPSRNGQGYAYSSSNTGSDLYGNQQIPLDPRANPNMALPNDLNNIFQQALSSFSNINQELQNTMQNQQRTLTAGMGGLGVPGVPLMVPNNGFNLGMPAIPGLPVLSGFPPVQGFPNFYGQPSVAPASMIPGLLQSAATVLQQNPVVPNLLNSLHPEPRSSFGVYSSSQSSSFNPNGVPKSYSEATVNDNGNITTYTAVNPQL